MIDKKDLVEGWYWAYDPNDYDYQEPFPAELVRGNEDLEMWDTREGEWISEKDWRAREQLVFLTEIDRPNFPGEI